MTWRIPAGIDIATMYVDSSTVTNGGRSYTRHLLRTSYRDNGKVCHRTVANISDCSEVEIEAIRLALKHKGELELLGAVNEDVSLVQGASFGAIWVVYQIASRLGIVQALSGINDTDDRGGRLAVWQVIARVIDQGSRLSAVRLARSSACAEILGLHRFDEDDLYENLDWLQENHEKIENALFAGKEHPVKGIFLYDVTSSYFEGTQNELSDFGYNRDGKKGKKQIVIGLLCDEDGDPLSIEVFRGNTQDPKTVSAQIDKIKTRFRVTDVTFVGDRGMIKSQQVLDLNSHGYHYITAITKPQIEKLLKENIIKMSLFDTVLSEVTDNEKGVRYILRLNPIRANEIAQNRQDKYERLERHVNNENEYLNSHHRANPQLALQRAIAKCKDLAISDWVTCSLEERIISLVINEEQRKEDAILDGCYVLKTDLSSQVASKEIIHARYKDLAYVEHAFRSSKTAHLEMRPIYLRLEQRTRAHAFVVMLAYKIIRYLTECWKNIDITVEEALRELASLCIHDISLKGAPVLHTIPSPRADIANLLTAANIELPKTISSPPNKVSTKVKLTKSRKQ